MIRLPASRRRPVESVVPMINVAFLLLIFFLMVAVIAPPDSLEIEVPTGEAPEAPPPPVVIAVSADGRISREGGDAVLGDLAGLPVTIRADATLEATALAALLADLAAVGTGPVTLAVTAP